MFRKSSLRVPVLLLLLFVALCLLSVRYFFRLDLTEEHRYSLSRPTRQLLDSLYHKSSDTAPIDITVYLTGDLNSGFLRLEHATADLLGECQIRAGRKNFRYTFVDPNLSANDSLRYQRYVELSDQGMPPIEVNEKDSEGKLIQKYVFPYAVVRSGRDSMTVALLKKVPGKTGYENLNISIENLEFEFSDAIRAITSHEIRRIVFLEGHGELSDLATYDLMRSLARYFQVDRGVLQSDATVLSPYSAVVIAAPQRPFSEAEKYILDQYLMQGGRILYLLDGVKTSMDTLSHQGVSPAIPLDLNLSDQLFRYGVRVNADLVQDAECLLIPADGGETDGTSSTAEYQPMSFYYAPLAHPSAEHAASRNLNVVKTSFVSTIDTVGHRARLSRRPLLYTSAYSRRFAAPLQVDLNIMSLSPGDLNLSEGPYMLGLTLEGCFPSVFAHRLRPKEITQDVPERLDSGRFAKIAVFSDADIARADVMGTAASPRPMPLGLDLYTGQLYANRSLLVNTLLYLTDDDGFFALREREWKLRMLDPVRLHAARAYLPWLNIALPIALLAIVGGVYYLYRRRRYAVARR